MWFVGWWLRVQCDHKEGSEHHSSAMKRRRELWTGKCWHLNVKLCDKINWCFNEIRVGWMQRSAFTNVDLHVGAAGGCINPESAIKCHLWTSFWFDLLLQHFTDWTNFCYDFFGIDFQYCRAEKSRQSSWTGFAGDSEGAWNLFTKQMINGFARLNLRELLEKFWCWMSIDECLPIISATLPQNSRASFSYSIFSSRL